MLASSPPETMEASPRILGRSKRGQYIKRGKWSSADELLRRCDRPNGMRGGISQEMAQKLAGSPVQDIARACYYAAAGEVDAMFETPDAVVSQRDLSAVSTPSDPAFDPIAPTHAFRPCSAA